MSLTGIPAQTAAAKYAEFNELFTKTNEKPSVSPADLRQLLSLREVITRTSIPSTSFQIKDTLFPEKINTREKLVDDVHSKIEVIRKKWKNHVGYLNSSHNCWMGSMLQVCRRIPHLNQALTTVGDFFNPGNSFDKIEMQAVAEKIVMYMQNPVQNQHYLAQAEERYKKITYSIFRLKTFQQLKGMQVPAAILQRFPIPAEYQDRIRNYTKLVVKTIKDPTQDQIARIFNIARDHILKDPETGCVAQEHLLIKCGHDLLEAMTAFDRAVVLDQPIPREIAQNARLALHHLSQTRRANGTLSSHFSPLASVSEDSYEGIQKIMEQLERIQKHQGAPVPAAYFRTEMIRCWAPDSASPLEPANPAVSRLDLGRYSSETLVDHQILVTVPPQIVALPQKKPMHLEDLLKKNCRYPGTESARYQREDGQIQRFNCVEVRQVIHGAPPQLSIALNRFVHLETGSHKNYLNVRVPRLMALPAEMTTVAKPIAYKLDAFVEHSGTIARGHYISYLCDNGQWIKCDDSTVTLMTDSQIDILLNKTVGDKTPYFFYYSKLPDEEQEDMLRAAKDMRTHAAGIEKEEDGTPGCDHLKLLESLREISVLLKDPSPDVPKLKEAIKNLKAQYPDYMKMLHLLIDINSGANTPDGTIEKMCEETPEQLNKTLKGWLTTSQKQNAIEQLMYYASCKKLISLTEHTLQCFEHMLTMLYSEGTEEEFSKLFNTLPIELQNQIQEALPVVKEEELTFEGAMKYGTLKKHIRDRLAKDLKVDLSSIGGALRAKMEILNKAQHAAHLMFLLDRIKDGANNKQVLKIFDVYDFPKEIKNLLFFKVCAARKIAENAFLGQYLFEQNPCILAQPVVSVEGREAFITETILGSVILALAPK